MKSWEMLKKTTPMYLCLSNNSNKIENDDIFIYKNNINNILFNTAIIENNNVDIQQSTIRKHFACGGVVIVNDQNKDNVDSWIGKTKSKYLGRFPLLNKIETNKIILDHTDPTIIVKRVYADNTFEDFFNVYIKTKKVDEQDAIKLFSKKIFDKDYFLYIAYYNNVPAGIWSMIKTDDAMMIVDIEIVEEFRQLNILKMLSLKAYNDARDSKVYNYSALATSQFSLKVALSYGYNVEGYCHIWISDRLSGELV